jgi:hypothetical protein
MAALLLLGGYLGLVSFLTRGVAAQNVLPFARPGALRHALPTISVGPGTPTPDIYCCDDPFTPAPQSQPTPAPTHHPTATATLPPSQPTATPDLVRLQVALDPTQAQCTGPASPLPPVTLTLDNSHSSVEVAWTLALGPGPSGAGTWAQAAPASQGTLPAGAAPQAITLTPDGSLCAQLSVKGNPGHFTAQVTTTPGGRSSTQIFTVAPAPLSGEPTPPPTPTPTPSPTATTSPATPAPSPTA